MIAEEVKTETIDTIPKKPCKSKRNETFLEMRCLDAKKTHEKGKIGYSYHNIALFDSSGNKRSEIDIKAEKMQIKNMHRRENAEFRKQLKEEEARRKNAMEAVLHPGQSLTYKNEIGLALTPDTGNTTLLLGSSKAGKSTLMMKIFEQYYYKKKPSYISFVYCESPQAGVYKEWYKPKSKNPTSELGWEKSKVNVEKPIFVKNPEKKFERIIETQKKLNVASSNKFQFLNLIDDIIDLNTGSKNSSCMNRLMLTLRNSNISSIICLQYSNLLSKMSRANVNNVYMTKFNSDEAIDVVIKTYLGSFIKNLYGNLTDDEKIAWYRSVTKNYGFIHIIPADNIIEFIRLD